MSVFRATVGVIGLIGAAIAAGPPATARDRPGTPDSLYGTRCPDSNWTVTTPSICVQLRNTASEDVVFIVEWTIDGEIQGEPVRRALRVECLDSLWAVRLECDGAVSMQTGAPREMSQDRSQGIRFSGLSYGSRYCFRFKAQDEDSVESEEWSQNVCVQEPSRPPSPPAPTNVQATLLPGDTGRGAPGAGTPPRVLVEWDADDSLVGYYLVQRYDGTWRPRRGEGPVPYELNRAHEETVATTFQDVADHPMGVLYRVCAGNVTGETCSVAASTSNWTGTVDRPTLPIGDMSVPGPRPGQDTSRPVPTTTTPPDNNGVVSRPRGGLGTGMSSPPH